MIYFFDGIISTLSLTIVNYNLSKNIPLVEYCYDEQKYINFICKTYLLKL